MNSTPEPLRLLALDGGGIRGLSELLILEEVMKRIKADENLAKIPKPCEYFDIIGGTGTGGIIAILLGRLCMSTEKAIAEYNRLAEGIFSKKKCVWKDGTFKASALEAAMKDIVKRHDESKKNDALMMTSGSNLRGCKTFVCAIPAQNMAHPRLFRSYEVRSSQEHNAKIWEVARATSAAPGFFKRIDIGTEPKEEFIDGGLRYNNPTREVFEEAESLYGKDCPISCIVSIGTGHPSTITLHKPGVVQRLRLTNFIGVLKKIAEDCEKCSDEFERSHGPVDGVKTYFRFNVQQGLQYVGLAEWGKLGEVKAHTLQYIRDAAVNRDVDMVVNVLKIRRVYMQEELEDPNINIR